MIQHHDDFALGFAAYPWCLTLVRQVIGPKWWKPLFSSFSVGIFHFAGVCPMLACPLHHFPFFAQAAIALHSEGDAAAQPKFHLVRKKHGHGADFSSKTFSQALLMSICTQTLEKVSFCTGWVPPCAPRSSTKFHEIHVPDRTKPQLANMGYLHTMSSFSGLNSHMWLQNYRFWWSYIKIDRQNTAHPKGKIAFRARKYKSLIDMKNCEETRQKLYSTSSY